MMQSLKLRPYFLLFLLAGATVLATAVFWSFLKPLALAIVFAVVLQGMYTRISKVLGGWPSTSALLTVVIGVFLILAPLSLIGALVGNQAHNLYVSLEESGGRSTVTDLLLQADATFGQVIPGIGDFSTNIDSYTREALQWIAEHAQEIFSGISSFLLSFFIFLIALYYFLRDGKSVRKMLVELSPLSDTEDEGIFARLELAINSTIKGSLTIALIQGVLTTVGFAVFGVPNAILWGTLAAVAALIPGFGTSLVIIPAVLFLFLTGPLLPAIGLLAWGVAAVGLVDNILGPKIIGRGMQLHPLLVLLSVLGGIMLFGPTGIFLGPLTLSLLFALLSIYADISRTA